MSTCVPPPLGSFREEDRRRYEDKSDDYDDDHSGHYEKQRPDVHFVRGGGKEGTAREKRGGKEEDGRGERNTG